MPWEPVPAPGIERDIIVFDGDCVLCARDAKFVDRWDKNRRFVFVTIQSEAGKALAERFNINAENPETNIAICDGLATFKSDAVLSVIAALPDWRIFSALGFLPKRLRDWLYDLLARNRYRLFGRHAQCVSPSAGFRARFIECASDL